MFTIKNTLHPLILIAYLVCLLVPASAQQSPPGAAPLDAAGYFAVGVEQRDNGNYQAAAAAFKRATELKPDWAAAYLELGKAYEDGGEAEKFLVAMREAYRLKPDDPDILVELAHAFRANQKFGDATAEFGLLRKSRAPHSFDSVRRSCFETLGC